MSNKRQKTAWEWFAANILNGVGSFIAAYSLPIGDNLLGSPHLDFAILFPLGFSLIAISYYYKFVKDYSYDRGKTDIR